MSENDMFDRLRAAAVRLSGIFPIAEVGVFGSRRRGTAHAESDLDVAVRFHGPVSLLDMARLQNLLSDAAGVPVDLVDLDHLKPAIGRNIRGDYVRL